MQSDDMRRWPDPTSAAAQPHTSPCSTLSAVTHPSRLIADCASSTPSYPDPNVSPPQYTCRHPYQPDTPPPTLAHTDRSPSPPIISSSHEATIYSSYETTTSSLHQTIGFSPYEYVPVVAPPKRRPRKLYEHADPDEGLHVGVGFDHPYARIRLKQERPERRRKTWNLRLETSIFTAEEISAASAPHRRKAYVASLEAHIDRLHEQLLGYALAPVPPQYLEPYCGLNGKTTKSMICGLQYDIEEVNLKLLELERANIRMEHTLDNLSRTSAHPSQCHCQKFPCRCTPYSQY